ncbi:MAG: hydrogenase expression/formation protein HypE [Phycisphaerales bacterium]|nr:hydrogenase expression/formation protein HypE [Phycisphaerales bacterium]
MKGGAGTTDPYDRIVVAHGGGGELTARLLQRHVLPPLANALLDRLEDSAAISPPPAAAGQELVFTTDSYVVTPIEFPGGDIGRLAVAGTVNDLAVMGATPQALSLGLILEEGLPLTTLDRIMASIAATAREAGVQVVTGDTKVIERRFRNIESSSAAADDDQPPGTTAGLLINTAGIGWRPTDVHPMASRVQPGDRILINGPIAEHGLAIMSVRAGLEFTSPLRSDVAPLHAILAAAFATGGVRFARDATRGGLAGVLADLCAASGWNVEVDEARIPLTPAARHAAELLGLDPLTVANEGKCVVVVAPDAAAAVLDAWRALPRGRNAADIGRLTDMQPPLAELITRAGGRRIIQRPYGEELPRIC